MEVYGKDEHNEDDDSDEEVRDDIRNQYVNTNSNNCMDEKRSDGYAENDDGDEEGDAIEEDGADEEAHDGLPLTSSTNPVSSTTSTSNSIHHKHVSSNNKPGYAYIFNHVNFNLEACERRLGSDNDVKQLKDTFEKLGMLIEIINDADVQTIEDTVAKIAAKDFSRMAYLVFAILSYGERNSRIVAKNGTYSLYDTILFNLRNETLRDKPKIMFVQCCKKNEDKRKLSDGGTSRQLPRYQLPENILIFYCSFEGFPLHEHQVQGTFFIKSLCKILREHAMKDDIKDVFKKLKIDLKKYNQIPYNSGTLVGRFCFGDYTEKV